ncbi:MAG: RluA family pseudouridine synthase [Oscillospiraceae bacterium]|nr:RluA family pseudouridine synthase [Candidatus Ruminococcus equi]
MNELKFTVDNENAGTRLDVFLSKMYDGLTRSGITKSIENGLVTVNGEIVQKSYKVTENDEVIIILEEPKLLDVKEQNIPLDIVYEDDDLLVVNKPKGMVVHPAAGNFSDTLVNALMYHCKDSLSGINGVLRPGIVHRIDKNTSGLLVVAKSDFAHNGLAEQIKEHSFTREYVCVVYGNIKEDSGTIDKPIGRHKTERKKMCVTDKNSKNAVTHYEVLERFSGFTYIKCKLETGRTHQIRVHMASVGHPIAGDDVYGPKKVITELGGQCLHAKKLGFIHPRSGEYLEFESEIPQVFADFLEKLRKTAK